jgi:membrane protease YdiL (CAAX protease family)
MNDQFSSADAFTPDLEQTDSNKRLNSTFDGFLEQINSTKHLNLTSFFVVSNIVFAIMGIAGFTLNAAFMLQFFLACYGVAAILGVKDYLNKEEQSFSSFIDVMAKRTLPIVAVAFTFRFFFGFYISPYLLVILKISSVLFSCQALIRAAKPDMSWRDRIINLLPVLLLWMSLAVMFNICGIADFIPFHEIGNTAFFSFFMFLGYYELNDNKIAWGTFNRGAWPKFLLAFSLQFLFICAGALNPAVISVLTSIPIAHYLTYMIFIIPITFNQTFAEEFIFRSSILYLKEELGDIDPYHIIFGFLCVVTPFLFSYAHHTYFLNSFMGLMFCFTRFLPTAVAWIALVAYSDGIEYSAGVHFGNNLALSLLFPLAAINGGLAVTVTWPVVLMALLFSCVNESVSFVPLMLCEKYFSPKASDYILSSTADNHGSGLGSGKGNDYSNNGSADLVLDANFRAKV